MHARVPNLKRDIVSRERLISIDRPPKREPKRTDAPRLFSPV